jgi:predicted phosphohydrolase
VRMLWLTDLHLDRATERDRRRLFRQMRDEEADAVIITGDISNGETLTAHLRELGRALALRPVYFVLGNHDFYKSSFAEVDRAVASVTAEQPNLHHLGQGEIIPLAADKAILGHRGWPDGRAGSGDRSRVISQDREMISDLRHLSDRAAFDRMRELGRDSATYFRGLLPYALGRYRHVLVATHAPVLEQAAIYNGRRCGRDFLPHFVNTSAGGVLVGIARHHTRSRLTVLCGHTHSAARVRVGAPNLEVLVGAPGVTRLVTSSTAPFLRWLFNQDSEGFDG